MERRKMNMKKTKACCSIKGIQGSGVGVGSHSSIIESVGMKHEHSKLGASAIKGMGKIELHKPGKRIL
jgi:hypothetical protein